MRIFVVGLTRSQPRPIHLHANILVWLLQKKVTEKLTLGGEIFHQTAATVDGVDSTGFNFGGSSPTSRRSMTSPRSLALLIDACDAADAWPSRSASCLASSSSERLAQPRCVFREIRLEHQIAAAYGGREEIVDAVQRLLREQALKTRVTILLSADRKTR